METEAFRIAVGVGNKVKARKGMAQRLLYIGVKAGVVSGAVGSIMAGAGNFQVTVEKTGNIGVRASGSVALEAAKVAVFALRVDFNQGNRAEVHPALRSREFFFSLCHAQRNAQFVNAACCKIAVVYLSANAFSGVNKTIEQPVDIAAGL